MTPRSFSASVREAGSGASPYMAAAHAAGSNTSGGVAVGPTYGQSGGASPCGCASGSDSISEAELKQITQAVIARLNGGK